MTTRITAFSSQYIEKMFEFWYMHDKPSVTHLIRHVPPDDDGRIPAEQTVRGWMPEFEKRAELLDEMVIQKLNDQLVLEKVEMLKRHANIAKEMQTKAVEYLNALNPTEFSSSSLIRLLTEGIRIERDSMGIPQALEKMIDLDDDDLVKQIEERIRRIPAEIEQLEDANL